MGMAPLALYWLESGGCVYGHDAQRRPEVEAALQAKGLERLQAPRLPEGIGGVVHTAAIPQEAPLLQQARRLGLPVWRRGEFLAQVAQKKRLIAIVGSHGKTTTTALAISLMYALNLPWEYVLGAFFQKNLPPARCTGSPWLVAEIDESDGTIEGFNPEYTVILNHDWDHPTQYPCAAAFNACLGRLMARTQSGILLPQGEPLLQGLANEHARCPWRTYGPTGDYIAMPVAGSGSTQTLVLGGLFEKGLVTLPLMGAFNVHNATAALAAISWASGASGRTAFAPESFKDFPGLQRRQECLLDTPELSVYTDYAHHPTELQALLEGLQVAFPQKTLYVLFEPHRYTRTRTYKAAFSAVLAPLDHLGLLDVYPASEAYIPDGDTPSLLKTLPKARYLADFKAVEAFLSDIPKNSLVLFAGAGTIHQTAAQWCRGRGKGRV